MQLVSWNDKWFILVATQNNNQITCSEWKASWDAWNWRPVPEFWGVLTWQYTCSWPCFGRRDSATTSWLVSNLIGKREAPSKPRTFTLDSPKKSRRSRTMSTIFDWWSVNYNSKLENFNRKLNFHSQIWSSHSCSLWYSPLEFTFHFCWFADARRLIAISIYFLNLIENSINVLSARARWLSLQSLWKP